QYRNYKSGKAKEAFEADLKEKRTAEASAANKGEKAGTTPVTGFAPSKMNINVNGEDFEVTVSYEGNTQISDSSGKASGNGEKSQQTSVNGEVVVSPLEGKFYFTKDSSETPVKVGDKVKEGDILGYVEAMKTYNAIRFDKSGEIKQILKENGSDVEEDDELVVLG
uniref:biotin/lipoyl-containing protein n=2 Tax=Anaerophaga thermohalophila TaxID=177400 RepID=UPI000237C4EB